MSTKLNKLLISVSLGLISYGASADNLHQIYQQALQGDPQIKQAQANRDAKFEAINQTRSVLLPLTSATVAVNLTTLPDSMVSLLSSNLSLFVL